MSDVISSVESTIGNTVSSTMSGVGCMLSGTRYTERSVKATKCCWYLR